MLKIKNWGVMLAGIAFSCWIGFAQASVVISGTRVVYAAKEREVTIKLTNEGSTPALVQTWLDTGDPRSMPGESQVPFVLTPPMSRIDPGKGQALRLVYTQEPLPQDKESLFWLNVLEVPPRVADSEDQPNMLQFAFRSRIKVFFRPAGLQGDASTAAAKVSWKIVRKDDGQSVLRATNPTPYHVTFSKVAATAGGKQYQNEKSGMVAPGGTLDLDLDGGPLPNAPLTAVDYTFVDDYGAGLKGTFHPESPQ